MISPASQPNNGGGLGGSTELSRADVQLVSRAVKREWPISPEIKTTVIKKLSHIVETDESARNVVSAAKTLVAADALNARREQIETPVKHEHDHSGSIDVDERRTILIAELGRAGGRGDGQPRLGSGNGNGNGHS